MLLDKMIIIAYFTGVFLGLFVGWTLWRKPYLTYNTEGKHLSFDKIATIVKEKTHE